MAGNLLRNGGFEEDWASESSHDALALLPQNQTELRQVENIHTPPGWTTFFVHVPDKWDQPEVRDTRITNDPTRVHEGEKGILLFTFYRRHRAGFMQTVDVVPGGAYTASAWAHAWSNSKDGPHEDDPRWSEGPGYEAGYLLSGHPTPPDSPGTEDDWHNFQFSIGLDPTGGMDPRAASVVWGHPVYIYNQYAQVPEVPVLAKTNRMTIFLKSRTAWAFKHNDAYWDSAELKIAGGTQPPAEGHTKLGVNVIRDSGGQVELALEQPALLVLTGFYGLAPIAHPGTLVVGIVPNPPWDAQLQYTTGKTPREAAQQLIDWAWSQYELNPAITYWLGHNEPVWNTPEEMAWYAQFEIQRMQLMANQGLKCAIGNFATGTPALALWSEFVPACREALRHQSILALHEYGHTWMWWMTGNHQVDPNEDEGDEGWGTLRYRKVYRQFLQPMGLGHLPLAITECGLDPMAGPGPPGSPGGAWQDLCAYWRDVDNELDCADYYFRQLVWYDEELQRDDYVAGAAIFCSGNFGPPWAKFDIAGDVIAKLTNYIHDSPATPFVYPAGPEPPTGGCHCPRESYVRVYVLLPRGGGSAWVEGVVSSGKWDKYRWTIGGSADDAGIGPEDRTVVAINPESWTGQASDLFAFFEEFYTGANVIPLAAGTPWELAVLLQDSLDGRDIAVGQAWPPWGLEDFGEDPGGGTLAGFGCLVSSLCMVLRKVYDKDLLPPVLNKILVDAHSPFYSDNNLNWCNAVSIFPVFDDCRKINRVYTATELKALQDDGWEIVLRHLGSTHFVYLERVEEARLHIIDPLDGQRKIRYSINYAGIRAAHVKGHVPDPPDPLDPPDLLFTLRGVHDMAGADWLYDPENNLDGGWCTEAVYLGVTPRTLDYTPYAERGIRMVTRLNYGYAVDDGSVGTMPGPDKIAAFEDAVVETVARSHGVWGWVYCNEMNNPREHPKGFGLTPQYYLESYNRVWHRLPPAVRFAPGAIDPYNAQSPVWHDWRVTWGQVLNEIAGANFMALHAYCHGPGPQIGQILSTEEFSHDPLKGVFYNLRVLESQQDIIPPRFALLPQIVTECNHYMKRDGTVGWDTDAGDWVREAYRYFAKRGVTGVTLFRFNYDQWRMGDIPGVLDALREL